MKPLSGLLTACILPAILFSCSNGGSGQVNHSLTLPKQGVIHERIACSADTSKTYALFIPAPPQKGKGETGTKLFPVIIAFDPHGNGLLPLTLYQSLAQQFGFMLIGSNASENGLSADEYQKIVKALMFDIHHIYPADTNRIYLLGFSGGSRVASMAAMYQYQVQGVIACGAGFGSVQDAVRFKFDYFGVVGTADFNLDEMLRLDEPLAGAGFRHFIKTFPGKHAWPPPAVMEDGFRWITLNAVRDGVLPPDSLFISSVINTFNARINESERCNQPVAAADACREAIAFLGGLTSTESFNQELNKIEKLPEYTSRVAYHLKVMSQEEEEKQEILDAFQSKGLSWWKEKIKSYTSGTRKGKTNPEDTLKDHRMIAFLTLFCYMNANAAMSLQDQSAAVRIIAIYEMADATNPEPNYMRAILFARRSEQEAAIGQLKIAIDKGFSDKQRLTLQKEFIPLNTLPAWPGMLKTMK